MKRKAEKAGLSLSESLRCPLCLENLKSPTLLSCGHTFCKVCLDEYDRQLLGQKYMECPVCKKRTKLGRKRIDGLVPNFSMIGLCDESPSKASNPQQSPNKGRAEYCSLHSQVYNDILCEDCKEFTCLACFFDKHQGHKFKKKEELDSELTKKRDSLLGKSKAKQAEIKRSISNVELQLEDMQTHLEDIATKIKNSHHKMVKDLAKKYRSLLQKICSIEDQSSLVCEEFIAQQSNLLKTIQEKSDFMSLEASSGPCNITDPNAIKARYMDFQNLEKDLERDSNDVLVLLAKERVSNIKFREASDTILEIGYVDEGITKSKLQQESTDHGSARDRTGDERGMDHPQEITGCDSSDCNMQEEDIPGTSGIQIPAAPGQTVSLAISNEIVLPVSISGLAAVPYDDAVMVSYGQKRDGVDFFYADGRSELLWQRRLLGPVSDIAFLSDGRVVTSGKEECRLYTFQSGYFTGPDGTFKCGRSCGKEHMLCTDQEDKIYAVHSSHLDVRDGSEMEQNTPRRVTCRKLVGRAEQVCVTKRGTVICSACSSCTSKRVLAYSEEIGQAGSSKCMVARVASDDNEHLYTAIDGRDRLLIASVHDDSDSFQLTRYIIKGNATYESKVYESLRLPHVIDRANNWCYMVSVTPNLISFANGCHLYFMHLGT